MRKRKSELFQIGIWLVHFLFFFFCLQQHDSCFGGGAWETKDREICEREKERREGGAWGWEIVGEVDDEISGNACLIIKKLETGKEAAH